MRLNITNGDVAADRIRRSRIPGEVLVWRDVLHEGPVPGGLSLEELSDVRAHFLAGCPWGLSEPSVREQFARRDEHLRRWADYEDVVLWFEHDLYDQLQLLQLLDWFADTDADGYGDPGAPPAWQSLQVIL